MDLNKKMEDLISDVNDGNLESLQRNKPLIDEIATFCRETGIYKKQAINIKNFGDDMNATDCYIHLIERVAHAPTSFHVRLTVILIMPLLADKLEGSDLKILTCSNCGFTTKSVFEFREHYENDETGYCDDVHY